MAEFRTVLKQNLYLTILKIIIFHYIKILNIFVVFLIIAACSSKRVDDDQLKLEILKSQFKKVDLSGVEVMNQDSILYTGDPEYKILQAAKLFQAQDGKFDLKSARFYATDLKDTVTEYALSYNKVSMSNMYVINKIMVSSVVHMQYVSNSNLAELVKKLSNEKTPIKRVRKGLFKDASNKSNEHISFVLVTIVGSDSTNIMGVTWGSVESYDRYASAFTKMVGGLVSDKPVKASIIE